MGLSLGQQGGQTITAMYAARKLYGCSLGEAKELVDSLRENEAPR
jgi:ribosomal protein L7/L12